MTKAQRRWLLNRLMDKHEGAMQARHDSAEDKKFQEIGKSGSLKCYDAAFGNNYYALTAIGRKELHGR